MRCHKSSVTAVERLKCQGVLLMTYFCLRCQWAGQEEAMSKILCSKTHRESSRNSAPDMFKDTTFDLFKL